MRLRFIRPGIFAAALLVFVSAGRSQAPIGAAADPPQQFVPPPIEEPAGPYNGFTYVGRPRPRGTDMPLPRTSSFVVTYNGFTPEAQVAFQYAVDLWGTVIQSPVPIRINATFRTDLPPYVLGSAGTAALVANFPNARRANTYYPAALANALAGTDLVAGDEIMANFNANFDWYLGTDGNARLQYDFVTVVLHELGHGLGFFSSFRVQNGVGAWGYGVPAQPLIYDLYMADNAYRSLANTAVYPNGSVALANALISTDVHASGAGTRAVDKGLPIIFSPNPWFPGASLVHLSDELFPQGDPNSLMTPALSMAEVIHDPGPLATAILTDMGWQSAAIPAGLPPPVVGVRLRGR